MSDTDIVALNTYLFQQFLVVRLLKRLFCSIDPDRPKTKRMSREHEVAENKAAVLNRCMPLLRCEHHENDRGTVEGIKAFLPATNAAVIACDLLPERGVRHGNNDGFLFSLSTGSVESRLDYLINKLLRYGIRLKFPNAAAFDDVFDCGVHTIRLLPMISFTIRATNAVRANGVMM